MNTPGAGGPAPGPDATAWMAPSPRLSKMRATEVGVVTLVAAGFFAAVFWVGVGANAAAVALVAVTVCGAAAWWFARRRVLAWGYQERDEDLMVRRGVLVQRLSVVPYGRMQFVDVTAGPVERLFRLATVKLHTAAAASDARIPGLERTEANRLRDRLAMLGEARAAGL